MSRLVLVAETIDRRWPGSRITRIWPLQGGMSAEMFGIEFLNADDVCCRVVARFPGSTMRSLFPDAAEHEFQTLEALCGIGVPTPRPLAVCDAPDGRFLLMEYLEGIATARPENPSDYVDQITDCLSAIHRTKLLSGAFSFLPVTKASYTHERNVLNVDLREPEVVDALTRIGDPPVDRLVLRHGDFWPGNLLWKDDRISGIVDWENALLGPALADVAITRLDLFWVLGREAMEAFTDQYLSLNPQPTESLTYWDLRAALRPMSNLSEWAGPYASLQRLDVTFDHLRTVLLEFVEDALRRT